MSASRLWGRPVEHTPEWRAPAQIPVPTVELLFVCHSVGGCMYEGGGHYQGLRFDVWMDVWRNGNG